MERADLLPGTLDLLILKAVSLGPLHGYAVLLRIEQITACGLSIEQGGRLVQAAGSDAWFWIHVPHVVVFAALAYRAFGRLADVTPPGGAPRRRVEM